MDLFAAARAGDMAEIKRLLQEGANPNLKNDKGHSPLMIASYNGHLSASQLLIEAGAEVNSVDDSTNSILMGVVFKGHSAIFELLVQAGADLDYENNKKQTAMDLAVMFGRRHLIFRINQLQNSKRSDGKLEQLKTWVQKVI